MTTTSLGPTGKSTGTSTLPFSSVVPSPITVPSGKVITTGASGIGSPVTGSTRVTLTVVLPSVVLPGSAVMSDSRPTTSTSFKVSLLLV